MILEFLKPQLWWILQILACVFVYIALVPSRTLGLCWKSYLFYITISITTCSWMFLKSYEWTRDVLLSKKSSLQILFDLGFNILDEATARWAAFITRKNLNEGNCEFSFKSDSVTR